MSSGVMKMQYEENGQSIGIATGSCCVARQKRNSKAESAHCTCTFEGPKSNLRRMLRVRGEYVEGMREKCLGDEGEF